MCQELSVRGKWPRTSYSLKSVLDCGGYIRVNSSALRKLVPLASANILPILQPPADICGTTSVALPVHLALQQDLPQALPTDIVDRAARDKVVAGGS